MKDEFLISFTDITELENINKDLQIKIIQEKEARQAKEIFLANMSHDIRTPLNGIVGTLDMLAKTQLQNKQEHLINICKNSSDMLLNIVNDILDFSKIESGKFDLDLQSSDFVEELLEISTEYWMKFVKRSVEEGVDFIWPADDVAFKTSCGNGSERITQTTGTGER
jgi:signal transduction histidine kinase